tara:strand:+ start:447 stop:650 length:204 start_codon:yes stop_codon:yes gene_type:complete
MNQQQPEITTINEATITRNARKFRSEIAYIMGDRHNYRGSCRRAASTRANRADRKVARRFCRNVIVD